MHKNQVYSFLIVLKYKLSLEGRENSIFKTNEKLNTLEGELEIGFLNNPISIETTVLYWVYFKNNQYYPIPTQPRIHVTAQAVLEKNKEKCTRKCVQSDNIIFTREIIPPELLCDDKKCLPQFSLTVKPFEFDILFTDKL